MLQGERDNRTMFECVIIRWYSTGDKGLDNVGVNKVEAFLGDDVGSFVGDEEGDEVGVLVSTTVGDDVGLEEGKM